MSTKNDLFISKYKFTTITDWINAMNAVDCTGRVGSINATRRMLEQVFGRPFDYSDGSVDSDGKTTTEWVIEFGDGEVATIYDYKRYEAGPPALDEFITWSIGGYPGTDVADRIHFLTPPF